MADTLVDAGPLIAVLNRTDPHHAACSPVIRQFAGPLIATVPVLSKAMHLLGRWTRGGQAALWEMVLCGDILVDSLTANDLRRMSELMTKYADLPMDFADASLVAVAERMGIERIFTVDRKDFSVYRLHGRTPFTILGP